MAEESYSANRSRQLCEQLRRLVSERAPAEEEIPSRRDAESEKVRGEYQAAKQDALDSYQEEKARAEADYSRSREKIVSKFSAERAALKGRFDRVLEESAFRCKEKQRIAKQKLQEAKWEANTVFEATKDGPKQRLAALEKQILAFRGRLDSFLEAAQQTLVRRRQRPAVSPAETDDENSLGKEQASAEKVFAQSPGEQCETPDMRQLADLTAKAERQWRELAAQQIAALFEGSGPLGLLVLFALVLLPLFAWLFGWTNWLWIPVGGAVAISAWGGVCAWLFRIARRRSSAAYAALRQTVSEAKRTGRLLLDVAQRVRLREEAAIAERQKSDLAKAEETVAAALAESHGRREAEEEQARLEYPPRLEAVASARDKEIAAMEDEFSRRFDEIDRRFRDKVNRLAAEHTRGSDELQERYDRAWNEMAQRWLGGMADFQQSARQLNQAVEQRFPDWNSDIWRDCKPAEDMPHVIPFGRVCLDLAKMEDGLPVDKRLAVEETAFQLPAMFPFPEKSLVFKAGDEGREEAARALQAVMLRMLTASRPGKIRFMILDPVGLGENFSAFMHLADFDERLVSSRIWTESSHIERRLVDLTEHMENVIQVYLRNEFATIQEYNEFAGEMAEPYRVLVVANFPANFTESAARRLASIVASGARCGVHTLLTVDTRQKMPHEFHLADLNANSVRLSWDEGRFVWEDSGLENVPLALESPPPPERFTEIVRRLGEQLGDVDRVEVPFEFVVPKEEDWWTADAAAGIDVPLGRAGAMKLQHLSLGRGTAQHVLVSGKTGSGKSNLLHAIITNVALWYGPEEVELYLVDFKKGVEFKAYSQARLPHARVIAIESEREFGQSVLERLDAELKRRGDIFRDLGVQNLAAFRKARPGELMPRVLLVIDEFQELFVEDDRIAQTAALLLDRLVRQGRAFGMHVLLGSQTLAGSYSLPRATIGQMAVRIALQCSEADAHLILSEENTAARLLTRPGEAIYNDANGLYEGNHPFQVVWLPDTEQHAYLDRVRLLAESRDYRGEPPIVFEGNAAADPRDNRLLAQVLAADFQPEKTAVPTAWLGAAVAIKEPTSVAFHDQGGGNLIIVGHREDEALGIMASAAIALAGQIPPHRETTDGAAAAAAFYVLDGTHPEAAEADAWPRLAAALPHEVRICRARCVAAELQAIAAEVKARRENQQRPATPVFIFVHNLGRFRELRKEEDSFGFSSSFGEEKTPSPAALFAEIVREGPAVGVHAIVWCDTYNTLSRWIDRQTIHDFELRVVFQMSAADSSNLTDTAAAAGLGMHRAVLYNEGLGRLEKFRPYAPPDDEWLAHVRRQFERRNA